mmetsp:Transcript_22590/g.67689  ORF Transcript_22590/g.67689 Transcript_22590/m.67689 type:complete len:201 (+) Transcript_22590:42-644(+)
MSKFRFGAPSPKAFVEKLASNDAATTSVDLSNNALFKMKTFEYCEKIADAMKTNTNCTELILKGNEITNADCAHIKTLLATNKSLTTLNLEANKIDSEGSILIAEGIKANTTLTTLILLGNGPFGESCMDAWLDAFTDNITLVDRPSEIDARWSWRCHVLQDDVSSSPPLQKPVETVLVRPSNARRSTSSGASTPGSRSS